MPNRIADLLVLYRGKTPKKKKPGPPRKKYNKKKPAKSILKVKKAKVDSARENEQSEHWEGAETYCRFGLGFRDPDHMSMLELIYLYCESKPKPQKPPTLCKKYKKKILTLITAIALSF